MKSLFVTTILLTCLTHLNYAQESLKSTFLKKETKKTFKWKADEKDIFGRIESNTLEFTEETVKLWVNGKPHAEGQYNVYGNSISMVLLTPDDKSVFLRGQYEDYQLTITQTGQKDKVYSLHRDETDLPLVSIDANSIDYKLTASIKNDVQPKAPKITNGEFHILDESAEPKDGYEDFYRYIAKELRYPEIALMQNIQGTVYVQFIVEKDGSLTNIEVLKGIGGGCDQEAHRIIQEAENWIPGEHEGEVHRQRVVLPIRFQLG